MAPSTSDGSVILAMTSADLMTKDFGPAHPRPAQVELLASDDPAHPTWAALVRHEPRLRCLWHLAQAIHRPTRGLFCANAYWYGALKPLLLPLVGWHAEYDDPLLTTSAAYDLAYQTLYELLPDCRHADWCWSLRWQEERRGASPSTDWLVTETGDAQPNNAYALSTQLTPEGTAIYCCAGCALPRAQDASPCPQCGETVGRWERIPASRRPRT